MSIKTMNNLGIALLIIVCMFAGAYIYYQLGEVSIPEITREAKPQVPREAIKQTPESMSKRTVPHTIPVDFGIVHIDNEGDFFSIETRMNNRLNQGLHSRSEYWLNQHIQAIMDYKEEGVSKYGVSRLDKIKLTMDIEKAYGDDFEHRLSFAYLAQTYTYHLYFIDEYADSRINMLRDYGDYRGWDTI